MDGMVFWGEIVIAKMRKYITRILTEIKHSQSNRIGDEGAAKIGEGLATNNTLKILLLNVRLQQGENKLIKIINNYFRRIPEIHSTIKLEMKEQSGLDKH